jgi:two-component system sensor histidine kinase KdpD
LRTPLTTLVGLADSLVQAPAGNSADTAETASIIRDQAQAMHRLISNLLDMARLNGENTILRREWQAFEEIVGSSLRLITTNLGSRQVAVDVPASLPLFYFDAVLMERVLFNLLENAVKYSPKDSPIRLAAHIEGDSLCVSICNAGAGFPPEMLEQVFELFVRGRNESNLPGVGLGLAICKAIVTAHGGSIHAENRPGGGCVCFTLPCGTPPPIEEEAA